MNDVEKNMLKHEVVLSPYATKSSEGKRLKEEKDDFRPSFFHDTDRIIYSLSYTRYIDKTQVFSFEESDHISKRMTHVQMVSKIARTIGRALNLNEDLIEAIALGHDIGHVPFGHTGEAILNEICVEEGLGYFNHNIQSVRTLMNLENNGKGINLCIQTLDGIMCHNGEFVNKEYYPNPKTKEEFLTEYENSYVDKNILKKLRSMTLEGCVVRISDIIGYIGRDIEDAVRIGVFDIKDLPEDVVMVLGSTNRTIVNTIVLDIIQNSLNKPYIKMSEPIYNAIKKLKQFNYDNIYSKANSKEQIEEYKKMFSFLFHKYVEELDQKKEDSKIYQVFLKDMEKDYRDQNASKRIAVDYIAGMTDDYFLDEYKKYKNKE